MKYKFSISILFSCLCLMAAAQERTDNPWQLDVAAGMQSFYAPLDDVKFKRSELLTTVGWGKPLGAKQAFEVTLQLGYARNNYQGDAVFLQLLGKYQPLLFQKIELGIGLGIGYRLGFYPSKAEKWNGSEWVNGSSFKGMIQVPAQLSIGYRSIHLSDYNISPYLACQLQALLGYTPDIKPMPITAGLFGLKIQKQ
ncbi:MAG TPA: hypothetical protein VGD26_11540 [Chitinophagaceae bacterium]